MWRNISLAGGKWARQNWFVLIRPDHLAQNVAQKLETSSSPSPIASTSSGIAIAISGTCSARTNPVRAQ
jgi:hypothetical protein